MLVSNATRDLKSYGKGKMSFVWCQRDNFHAVSRKLCPECAKQDRISKFWTHAEKDFVKNAFKGMTANVILRQVS